MRTLVNFTHVNKIEAMYERPRVNVRVERGSTFTFMRGLSYIASIFFLRAYARKNYVTVEIHLSSLKLLNVDHSVVNGDVRRNMLTEKLQNCNGFFTTHHYPLF